MRETPAERRARRDREIDEAAELRAWELAQEAPPPDPDDVMASIGPLVHRYDTHTGAWRWLQED